jgi:hypothetical protein
VLAGAVSSHYYYILPLLPPAALFVGCAVQRMLESDRLVIWPARRSVRCLVALGLVVLVVVHAVFYVTLFADLYDVTKRVPYHLEAARIVRERTEQNAILIMNDPPNALNTTLTYYAHRKSWPFSVGSKDQAIRDLEALRSQGGTVYVAVDSSYGSGVTESRKNEEFWQYLNERYMPIAVTKHYLIFDLSASQGAGQSGGGWQMWSTARSFRG